MTEWYVGLRMGRESDKKVKRWAAERQIMWKDGFLIPR